MSFCQGHGGHGHVHEEELDDNPAYKWSRAANEDEILEEDIVDLPPKHTNIKPNGNFSQSS